MSEQQPDQPSPKKPRKRLRLVLIIGGIFFALVILVGATAGGLFYYATAQFEQAGPAAGSSEETIFDVPLGQGVFQIAQRLESEGLIRDALIFRLGVVWHQSEDKLRAGEYVIPAGASMMNIMEILREGKVLLYKMTVPEGLTSAQVIRLIAADENLIGELSDVPSEGSLLPETYFFPRGTTRTDLVDRMKRSQQSILTELWNGRAEGLPIVTPDEAVILASIVEKETGIAEERPQVASVFINRLNRSMRLASDPTIIYGLTGGEPLGRGIRQSELKKVTPYNTYEIDGLPPTPIANPGRDAIAAVLNPPETKYLYFVADGTGGHAFATSYREHQRNVASWRKIERQQKNSQN